MTTFRRRNYFFVEILIYGYDFYINDVYRELLNLAHAFIIAVKKLYKIKITNSKKLSVCISKHDIQFNSN